MSVPDCSSQLTPSRAALYLFVQASRPANICIKVLLCECMCVPSGSGRELKSKDDFMPPPARGACQELFSSGTNQVCRRYKIVHHCSLCMRCLNWWVLWGLSGSPHKLCDTGANLRVLGVQLPVIAKDCHHTCSSNTASRDGTSGSNGQLKFSVDLPSGEIDRKTRSLGLRESVSVRLKCY